MRAQLELANTGLIARQVAATPFVDEVRGLVAEFAEATEDTVRAVLDEAARFAVEYLEPLNEEGDRLGCRMKGGRVKTVASHGPAWRAFAEGGWLSIDLPRHSGGQNLPQFLVMAVQEVMDRSCTAFGMMPVPVRSAARLIAAFAPGDVQAEWLPRLCSGEWSTTICISEAEAGSDVPRLRTRAEPGEDGLWRITGEKQWISFGDQDLTSRIGHCLLARTEGAKGLSLFLVPDHFDGEPNGVAVRRIEHKLGLNTSPTCVMGFEGAKGYLLGEEGRGLAQMFVMIAIMRTAVGVQGIAAASGAFDLAFGYAQQRRQGGRGAVPDLICQHADVQRMLMGMAARTDVLRAFGLTVAAMTDISRSSPDAGRRARFDAMVQWMLPMFKTIGGETGFEVASEAIQIFGGAGYTREWPVEQILRDNRVLTIFEGASGIQALDILHRRLWRDGGKGQALFLEMARTDAAEGLAAAHEGLDETYGLLEQAARDLMALQEAGAFAAEAGATAFLHLSGLAVMGWAAARMALIAGDDPASRRLRASGNWFLTGIAGRAEALAAEIRNGAAAVELFSELGAQ